MKKTVCLIVALLIAAASVLTVSAATAAADGAKIKFPDEMTVLTPSALQKNKTVVTELGYTVSSLKKYMEDNGIRIMAVDGGELRYVIKTRQNDFSEKTGSFNSFDGESLESLNKSLFEGNASVCTVNDIVYFKAAFRTEGAKDNTYQYVTVQKGVMYSFICYGRSAKEMDSFMEGVTVEIGGASPGFLRIAASVLIFLAIIAGLVAAGIIVISLHRDLSDGKEKANDENGEVIHIKRRRLKK